MRAYTADMIPGGASPVINVSQYDNDYAVTVTLIEGAEIYTPPSGATIMVEGTKPDSNGFSYACTYQGNVVTVPIYTQMTAVAGRFPIELVVYQSGLRVGSCNITLAVERAPLDSDEIISDSDIPAIIALAQAQADAAASSAASAETAAQELQSLLIHETASGAVASFADGADDIPMQSLITEITPVQDLNGYSNPWPGGGGKNLLENTLGSITENGVTFTANDDGTITANGTASSSMAAQYRIPIEIDAIPRETNLYFNGCPSSGTSSTYQVYMWDSTANARAKKWDNITRSDDDTGASANNQVYFETGKTYYYTFRVKPGVTVNNITFKPMIRLASVSDGTYAPYSNICPISGRTGMTVTRSGKNLLPSPAEQSKTVNGITISVKDGVYTISGTASGTAEIIFDLPETITLTAGQTISFFNTSAINGVLFYFRYVNTNGSYWGLDTINKRSTIPNGREVDRVRFLVSSGVSVNMQTTPMLCLEGYTQAFEPYKGTTYPVSWQTEAGTIYGGTLDVVSGVLTVDSYYYEVPADSVMQASSGGYQYFSTPNRPIGAAYSEAPIGLYCNRLPSVMRSATRTNAWGIAYDTGVDRLQMKLQDITTQEDARTWVTNNPLQIVYKLATPQTYQLTPTEVRTLLGGNTIYTDAGNVSVEYIADTKLYIDNKIAQLQALVLEN